MAGRRQIEARWGVNFWDLLRDFADQGLPRSDVAKALGYDRDYFYRLLRRNPKHDYFEAYVKSVSYLQDTGETMGQALIRMAAEGRSWNYAARTIGYSTGAVLKRAARSRGIQTELRGTIGRPRIHPAAPRVSISNFTTGWPSWAKVYRMAPNVKDSVKTRSLMMRDRPKLTRASPTASVTVTTEQHGVNVT